MGIITRYLIRAHAGPFLFAFTALTGLLFLNAVAQRMENLVGKGLPWGVIGEFVLLSLPHTIALTLPMAVLVSVLYTFSELTAANEITAMSAGGIKPSRMLAPMLGVGVILAGVMFYFNDQVLPETNHQLKNLIIDLSKKSPTLELRERVINHLQMESQSGTVYLQAATIDPITNEMTDVVIYDLSDPYTHRTTYALSGKMEFNEARTDLYLTLYDGEVREVGADRSGEFNRSEFDTQIIPLRGVSDELERQQGGTVRSDREMSVAMLHDEVSDRIEEIARVHETGYTRARMALDQALGHPPEGSPTPYDVTPIPALTVDENEVAGESFLVKEDDMTKRLAMTGRQNQGQIYALQTSLDSFWVEIHKKFAISFACIVFVLMGAPLAIRFPRGGVGMVIAVSVGIFAVYWAGLIGGENLADKGVVTPFLAMWAPDLAFLALGLFLALRMGKSTGANRGGGLDEVLFAVGDFARRLMRPRRASA
jgi:lipopolysaccharide export system permease protein